MAIVDSDRAVNYLLLHGDHPETAWSTASLSDEEARDLLAFLREVIPNPAGFDLIRELERRLGEQR